MAESTFYNATDFYRTAIKKNITFLQKIKIIPKKLNIHIRIVFQRRKANSNV